MHAAISRAAGIGGTSAPFSGKRAWSGCYIQKIDAAKPDSIASATRPAAWCAPWLHLELTALGLPMVLLETRHAAAALDAQRNNEAKVRSNFRRR
jgi:hypothetical protein